MSSTVKWYALMTKQGHEKKVKDILTQKNYECFFPTFQKRYQQGNKVLERTLPLFPSYVFCRFDPDVVEKAVTTNGVIRILGFGSKPLEIPITEIEAMKVMAKSNLLRKPWLYIPDGTIVSVNSGPLTGIQGIMYEIKDGNKNNNNNINMKNGLILSITLLQRSVLIELEEDTIVTIIRKQVVSNKKNVKNKYTPDNTSDFVSHLL